MYAVLLLVRARIRIGNECGRIMYYIVLRLTAAYHKPVPASAQHPSRTLLADGNLQRRRPLAASSCEVVKAKMFAQLGTEKFGPVDAPPVVWHMMILRRYDQEVDCPP